MTKGSIKIGIAEDHERFRKSLKNLLQNDPSVEVVLEAANGLELINRLSQVMPDIILMDIRMPLMNGFEATKAVSMDYPKVKVIAFTQFDFEENIVEMAKLGVKSFLSKNRVEDLTRVLKIVYEGGVYFPDEVASIIQKHLNRVEVRLPVTIQLSETELTLLRAISEGLSSSQIGLVLHKSSRTIEEYREKLYDKFGVENKEQLLTTVVRNQII